MSVKKVFFLYNLKPDRKVEDYIKWSKEVNHPMASTLKTITEFHEYVTVSSMRGKPIPYQFIEDIVVTDHDAYTQEINTVTWPTTSEAWRDWVGDYIVIMTDIIK